MIGCYDCGKLTSGDCGKHPAIPYGEPRQAMRCPVCEGRGYVPNGFYGSCAGVPWSTTSTTPDTCKSCEGKGYVVI